MISQLGEFRSLAVDPVRGRLYATDDASFDGTKVVGLVVIDLNTHGEITRIPLSDLTGVALSPGASRLVVGSRDGYLRVINPDTLLVTREQFFYGDPFTAAYMWDMAFDGEDQLVVSEGSFAITCEGRAMAVNLTSMTKIAELSEPPCGIWPYSGVSVVPALGRLYVLQNNQVSAYYLSNFTKIFELHDTGFTTQGELSPDGQKLVFSSGSVYDAATLNLLADVGHSGDVDIDPAGVHAYFAQGPFIDAVRLTDYAFIARFAFGSLGQNGPPVIERIAVDRDRAVAYVLDPDAQNANYLHAVPLFAAFLDPFPMDGAVLGMDFFSIRASVSGGIDTASVRVKVDQVLVTHGYDPAYGFLAYLPPSPWTEGLHHVEVSGTNSASRGVWLNWSFTVDMTPPELVIDGSSAAYRVPNATVRGRIIDASPVYAEANGLPLTVEPVTGAFSVNVMLGEGGNLFTLYARDLVYNENHTYLGLLYVPPTTRYVDVDAGFSVEYPTNWSLQTNITVQGVKVEASMTGSAGVNLNVIAIPGLSDFSQAGILSAASQGYASVSSRLPGFYPLEQPAVYDIPDLFAATYAFHWDASGTQVYQRQVLASDPVAKLAWILTFTSLDLSAFRYDPLFLWMADTLRPERPSPPAPASFPVVPIVGGAIIGVVAALGVALFLFRRKRTRAQPPSPFPSPPVTGGPPIPPPEVHEPPRIPPPPGT